MTMKNPNSSKKNVVAQSGKSQENSNECLPLDSSKGEIVLYQPDETISLEVRMEDDTVWLTQQQMADLFSVKENTITYHIQEIYNSEELKKKGTTRKNRVLRKEGKRLVNRWLDYYNLDMIISVGYKVNSKSGVKFRQWATKVLKEYIIKGYVVKEALAGVNDQLQSHNKRINKLEEKVDFFVRTSLPPVEGVFFEGQVFDAYRFASDLIRKATRSIVLIDNYVDDSVLAILDKRQQGVSATIYTQKISQQLQLDIDKHNTQYPAIKVEPFNKAHDRFLLIDDEVYHIGASIKDLGKKWFAFTCLKDIKASELMNKIQ